MAANARREDAMLRLIVVGLVAGVAFLVLDGFLHANPLAQELCAAYRPIARASVNVLAASPIDVAYGLILVAPRQHRRLHTRTPSWPAWCRC
jgi:hypothetical protein